jgi:hypothetical protein
MGFDFRVFGEGELDESFVDWLVDDQWIEIGKQLGRLWEYYQNNMYEIADAGVSVGSESGRNYLQGQEFGLPSRITGVSYSSSVGMGSGRSISDISRKEVVIENDITWRINAMVDFLFGKGVNFVSKAPEESKRKQIEKIIKCVFAANGGAGFFQDMAVLGSVYGFVDCLVRPSEEVLQKMGRDGVSMTSDLTSTSSASSSTLNSVFQLASTIGLDLIEAPRALPVLDEDDYRKIKFYIQHFYQQKNSVDAENSFLSRILGGSKSGGGRSRCNITEIIGADTWQRYENGDLIAEGDNPLGVIPVVHVQNVAQPYYYEGLSDVEQLIGLQDELNTRLSDRASRVTFQAFKMYLAKGIEGGSDKTISPGRMWFTDNPDASIEQFGGDSAAPSEDIHIAEIREAMDKVSGVTPVVAGVLKNKLGNLTSGVALKMTFMGMLSKTARKQNTYGEGLRQIIKLVLETLDRCGVYATTIEEREVEVVFPNPLPEDAMEQLQEAQIKKELGVSREQILSELGY